MAKKMPDVHFVTARDLLQLYRSPDAPVLDKKTIAEFLSKRITFLSNDAGDLSAADLLIQLLDLPPQTVDGPVSRGQTTYGKAEIPGWLFEKAKSDAADYIRVHHRLPSEVFLGSETLSLADFTATAAQHVLTGGGTVRVARGHLEFERYFSNDPRGAFKWVIHPPDFAAPELLELARLQGWTLKPATLR